MQLVQNRVSFLSAGKEKQFYDYFFFLCGIAPSSKYTCFSYINDFHYSLRASWL